VSAAGPLVYLEFNSMTKTILIAALLSSALMAQNGPIANGVYAVEEGKANKTNLVIRQYEGKDVLLNTANFAPLVVEGKPEIHREPRASWLMIQLAPEAANRLEDLTRSHMNRPIAVVVSDKILSTPTVRSVIKDGKARVTPCENESCETLLRQLSR
jgi:preprotein translocase subunit SecD